MYKTLKKTYHFLLPRSIHYKIEPLLRQLLFHFFYKGNSVCCQLCKSSLKKFITIEFINGTDNSCPKCGSLSRTRTLFNYINNEIDASHNKILDFSPHRSIYNFLSKKKKYYIANDFDNQFYANTNYDITKLPFEKEKFNLIICYHILEHIPDDKKAIKNLYRVLKNNGDLLIQVPLKEGKTDEDLTITDPKEREIRFGQVDHVRFYGKTDLINKLNDHGFKVKIIDYSENFSDELFNYYGLKKGEFIIHCKKSLNNLS